MADRIPQSELSARAAAFVRRSGAHLNEGLVGALREYFKPGGIIDSFPESYRRALAETYGPANDPVPERRS